MSAKISKALANVLGIAENEPPKDLIINESQAQLPAVIDGEEQEALSEEDFILARANIRSALEHGAALVKKAVDLANVADTARAFEVAFDGLDRYVEMNEKLLDLHHKRMNPEIVAAPNKVVNNVFVGSTAELQKYIREKKQAQDDNVIDVDPEEV